jgi:hypothetical protein
MQIPPPGFKNPYFRKQKAVPGVCRLDFEWKMALPVNINPKF